ncbi:class I SAM-dependent methyltransferase [Thermodesulfobacteriota bacterium]
MSTVYNNESEKYQHSPKSCGYASDTAHLSRLNIMKRWLDYDQLKKKKVLDIGCGIGLMTQPLIESNHVWGVDISNGLLQLAMANGLRTLAASADLLPFGDDSFDIVLCVGVIPYYEKPDEIFSEICRVIKPGGRIVITATTGSLLIKAVRYLKILLGGTSQLVRLYSAKEIADILIPMGYDVLDSSVAYGGRVASLADGRIGLRFRIFARVAAVLATVPE